MYKSLIKSAFKFIVLTIKQNFEIEKKTFVNIKQEKYRTYTGYL